MRDGAGDTNVTIKCRLGIDDQALDETLPNFIETIAKAGCETVIVHARKAWLQGLSPKENRTKPPINYQLVKEMKARFPTLRIMVNGQIETVEQGLEIAESLDGFMMGRAAYNNPWVLTDVDPAYGDIPAATERVDVANAMIHYLERVQSNDRTAKALIRHMMGLFAGEPGARLWRRTLSEGLAAKMIPSDILASGLTSLQQGQAA